MMNTPKLLGIALITLGILFFTPFSPLITLLLDTTPPTRSASTPSAGITYSSLTSVSIGLTDGGVGVGSVYFKLDAGSNIGLSRISGTEAVGTWGTTIANPSAGSHTFTFTFSDQAGNTGTYSGSLTIYTALTGTWYVNTRAVASTADRIILASRTVSFKFVKSTGLADTSIACTMTITSGGLGSVALVNSAAGTWTGSYTFSSDGTFGVELKANDGIGSPVVMSILQIGGETTAIPVIPTGFLIGVGLIIAGAFLVMKREE